VHFYALHKVINVLPAPNLPSVDFTSSKN